MEKSLKIDSKIENINKVEKIIDELSEEFGFHSDLYGNLLIATIEGVNNCIVHGNKFDENKSVDLNIFVDEKTVQVKIEDEGPGFNYEDVPDPTTPENIENFHGRGIFLMKNLADKIEFNENGTQVKLTFNI